MCIICFTEWHNVPPDEYQSFWDYYRDGHDSKTLEEAWHSDIPKGMARALEDGQTRLALGAMDYYLHAPYITRSRQWLPRWWTGKWSTQEHINSIG